MRGMPALAIAVVTISGIHCRRDVPGSATLDAAAPPASASAGTTTTTIAAVSPSPSPPPPEPVAPANVIVPGDRYAVVVRSPRKDGTAMLFMAGMCVHPGGYAGAFQYTASARGPLVALQGDVSCGGGPDSPARMWSSDLVALDHRVDAAFEAAGFGAPREITVIGYSQGAERAEQLVARWPNKYSRAVLIASPLTPSPKDFARARGVAFMAGTHDVSLTRMRAAATAVEHGGTRAAFFLLPNAHHGQMGEAPEESMRAALDFVDAKP